MSATISYAFEAYSSVNWRLVRACYAPGTCSVLERRQLHEPEAF